MEFAIINRKGPKVHENRAKEILSDFAMKMYNISENIFFLRSQHPDQPHSYKKSLLIAFKN